MCGIFGIIRHHPTSLSADQRQRLRDFITALAVTSAARGTDATGIAAVDDRGQVELYKDVLPSYDFIHRERWKDLLELVHADRTFAVMGHTRYKTTGLNTRDNAHPFKFSSDDQVLVGLHNGTINNHREFGPMKKYEVDSANFLHSLAHQQYDSWPALLERARGNFAFVLASGERVAIARNDGSPCYLAYSDEYRMTVFASTEHMLWSAEALSRISLSPARLLKPGRIAVFRRGSRKALSILFDAGKSTTTVTQATTVVIHKTNNSNITTGLGGLHVEVPRRSMCTQCLDMVRELDLSSSSRTSGQYGQLCHQCQNALLAPRALLAAPASTNVLTPTVH